MTDRSKWLIGIGVSLVALALVAGIVLAQRSGTGPEEAAEETGTIEATVSSEPTAPAPETSPAPAAEETSPAPAEAESPSGREFGFITDVAESGGAFVVTIDYAQFLTGQAAADAAAAAGEESPPPNDYYIINVNPKLRRFPVAGSARVTIVHQADGGVEPSGYGIALDEWVEALNEGPLEMREGLRRNPYWITLDEGRIVAIEEVYLP